MEQQHRRILVVSQHYWPENFRITDICRGFVESGVEVDVLCGLPNYPKGEWFEGYRYMGPRRQQHEGVQIFRAGEVPRRGNTAARIFLTMSPGRCARCSACQGCTGGTMTPGSVTRQALC